MANNNDGQIVLGLDIPKTVSQINADIKKLQNQLEQVKATGVLDTSATIKQINAQIASLQSQLKEINLKANIDVNSASKNAVNQARQVGQQIGNNISQGISSGVNKAKSELKSFSDLTNFSELNKKIEHLQIDPSALKNYSAILDEVKSKYAEFGQVKITNEQFNNGILERFKVNIEQVNGDLKETKSFMMALNDDKDTFVFDGIIKGSESVVQHLDKTKNAINQTADAINNLQLNNKADKLLLSTDLTKLETDYKKFGVVSQEVENDIKEAKKTYDSFVNAKGTDRLEAEMNSYTSALAKAKSSWKELSATQVSLNQRTSQMTSMQEWMRKNGAATKDCKDKVRQLIAECNTCDKVRFEGIKNEFKALQVQMGQAGKLGNSFLGSLKEQAKSFTQWISVSGAVMKGVNAFRKATTNVIELDTKMVELSKVSDLTKQGLEDVTSQCYDLGESLSKTGTDVLDAVTTFKRAGYDIADSMKYAEEALKTANISENLKDASQNASSLVNIMKGFQNETPEFAKKINDAVNQVSNTEAVNFDNLIDGATRLSAVADQAGLSFEQMLGTLTGGYEILGNMEKVATGQITIFSRLQAIQLDGEEEVSTVAKLQEKFSNATKGAVNIVDQTSGQLRNVYDILDDLAGVWDTLDKNTREALAIEAAGKIYARICGNTYRESSYIG